MGNIVYRTDQLSRFYQSNRVRWGQFYPSERFIFEQVAQRFGPPRKVLDAGCAAGGLGLALQERFGTIEAYTGVDINRQVITLAGQRAETWQKFICGDVATLVIPDSPFQWVVSLGCADWNVEPVATIRRLWGCVSQDGFLLLSLRLTDRVGVCDPKVSYQHIDFFGQGEKSEFANYVVFNVAEALALLTSLSPDVVLGYGYWGKPSSTAVTPYERVAFTVFALRKPASQGPSVMSPQIELNVPADLLEGLRPGGIPTAIKKYQG